MGRKQPVTSPVDKVAAWMAKIESRSDLVALSASWVSEPEGFYLQLDAFMSRPSSEHPALDRNELDFLFCGGFHNAPEERAWPELVKQRALCERLAEQLGVPLHFPSEPYPDTSRKAWWAMWSELPQRTWHLYWMVIDTTAAGERRAEGELDADGQAPGHAFEAALVLAKGTAVDADVLDREIRVWTDVDGQRVSTRRCSTIRARYAPDAVPLLRAVGRGDIKLSHALRRIIDEHGLPYHEAALLVDERFDSTLSDGRTYMAVDAWARGEPGGDALDDVLGGKLRYREVDDANGSASRPG
jgi:hypothetical protein